ncbi:hypothetical protein EUTSA_v10023001mg [Eutrema salsugineum]|uniref:RING-type domain-containing protein n=1 Tax=Eutrema salsugineum TaxID=72664 RepID=V4M7R9_EUTSA|nr:hypothetical protein EUTSA_v10023001mg [Eutrema salsugineum]
MSLESNNVNGRKPFAFDLNLEPVDDDGICYFPENSDPCSVCLEPLVNTNDNHRTLVTLKCGHKFHLDCIGSAFNAKNSMQCPYCKQIEPGQWQYPTHHPIPNISEEDEVSEEEETNIGLEGGQQCQYIEYSFTIPQSSAAGIPQNFIFSSHWITNAGEVRYNMPPNRMIFWSASESGVIRGRHYADHPFYDHR